MIKKDFYEIRDDGIKLYRSYSDKNFYILKDGTEEMYEEAIDIESASYTYSETDIPIEIIE